MTKVIKIRDDVYKKLLKVKRKGESFSELFERLIYNINSVETLKKLRGCIQFTDKKALLKEIYSRRRARRL